MIGVETAPAKLRAPFPWFGGKSRVAELVWSRLGNVPTYNEPFAGSLAVLLGRPHEPRVETVNDLDCVAPQTRILRSDMSWALAQDIRVGDSLIGFDEQNGEPREGLRAPKRYRRLAEATVTAVRTLEKPCYKLTFDDGTEVVASANHLWLGGSHASGGRGWRWLRTESLVCNRATQRSWVLKVVDVQEREEGWEAGWLGGLLDGEGNIRVGPGLSVGVSQNDGTVLATAERLLSERGFAYSKSTGRRCRHLQLSGGMATTLGLLMRVRPQRLIQNLKKRLGEISLYGRDHRAVGLVKKEFLGSRVVIAIETTSRTFIAEGLASHNCYLANFWRAVQGAPDEVAYWADSPVNEADLHARHLWLVATARQRAERVKTDAEYYDAQVAGWWVWGQCLWIGSGWCEGHKTNTLRKLRHQAGRRGVIPGAENAGYESASTRRWQGGGQAGAGSGVHALGLSRQMPRISAEGGSISGVTSHPMATGGLYAYMHDLAARLRRVRVCCGDWKRVLTPSVTTYIGLTGVFLDPPYAHDQREICYAEDHDISQDVRAWALANGDNPDFRIALCGYEGEHDMPASWECVPWKAHGGYSRTERGVANRSRERIWFSPNCLRVGGSLFDQPIALPTEESEAFFCGIVPAAGKGAS